MTDSEPIDDGGLITHVSHRAMATDFVVMLPEHMKDRVESVVEVLERLDAIEAALTIYRPDSEVSKVNREAGERPVAVSISTFRLLQRALLWSDRTGGALDITAGPLIDAWGFTRRSGRKPTAGEIDAARRRVGYQQVQLDEATRSVRFTRPGMSINLGAVGKGDALDRLARQLKADGVSDFLIHGGNSSVVAAGDQRQGSGQGWAVGVAHPTKPPRRLGGLWLRDAAMGTSGSGKQFFHHQGKRYGHVIDPRTGYPAGDLLSLTVITPLAVDADALATGLFVAGSAEIRRLCQSEIGNEQTGLEQTGSEQTGLEETGLEQTGNEDSTAWRRSAMILAGAGRRQDQVDVETFGDIDWLDAPETEPRPDAQRTSPGSE